jgi:hypothetical protein
LIIILVYYKKRSEVVLWYFFIRKFSKFIYFFIKLYSFHYKEYIYICADHLHIIIINHSDLVFHKWFGRIELIRIWFGFDLIRFDNFWFVNQIRILNSDSSSNLNPKNKIWFGFKSNSNWIKSDSEFDTLIKKSLEPIVLAYFIKKF